MRVRQLLPLTMMLLASCGSIRQQASPTQTTIQPTITIVAPPTTRDNILINYPDLRSAVSAILTNDIQVIAFGEIHKARASNLTSTMQIFAREIIPLLAEQGITDLVIEHIPSGDLASRELAEYTATGQFGPFLSRWFAYNPDYCGIIEIIRQSQASGLRLHGSHASSTEEYRQNITELPTFLNRRLLETIQPLISEGRRIAVYSGAKHNNIVPISGQDGRSFGQIIERQLGNSYREVDLYQPDLAAELDDQAVLSLDGLSSYIPETGVNLIERSIIPRSIIVLPRSNDPIIQQIPLEAPSCP
jgi:hypothetical protein